MLTACQVNRLPGRLFHQVLEFLSGPETLDFLRRVTGHADIARANKLANRVFESWDDIVTACCNAWNDFTRNPVTVSSATQRDWERVNQ